MAGLQTRRTNTAILWRSMLPRQVDQTLHLIYPVVRWFAPLMQ